MASATTAPASSKPARVRVRRAGGELGPGQQRGHSGRTGQRVDVGVGQMGAVVGAGRAELDRELRRPGRRRAGWRGRGAAARPPCRPAGRPAPGRASNAPRSQNTSTHRACGAAAVEHLPAHQRDIVVGTARELGRHHVRAEEGGLGGELPRRPAATGPRRTVLSPYPLLISMVVVPWRSASWTSRAVPARSSSSVAVRVAATVVRMPPPVYGSPAIRAANSAARSPAKTRWAWLSTKPGMTAPPPASSTRSAAGALAGRRRPRRPGRPRRPAPRRAAGPAPSRPRATGRW